MTSANTEKKLKIFAKASLPMLEFDRLNREDAADGNDHAPEALRYGLMSRPHGNLEPVIIKKKAYDPLSLPEAGASWYSS